MVCYLECNLNGRQFVHYFLARNIGWSEYLTFKSLILFRCFHFSVVFYSDPHCSWMFFPWVNFINAKCRHFQFHKISAFLKPKNCHWFWQNWCYECQIFETKKWCLKCQTVVLKKCQRGCLSFMKWTPGICD